MKLVLKAKTVLVDTICEEETEFEDEKTDYRSERRILVRDFNIQLIIQFILHRFKIERSMLYIKNKREAVPAKSMIILLLRGLCGASCKDICAILGNLTAARISSLSTNGIKLINNNEACKNMMDDFIKCYC
jgi:hypothetical protein